jgi:hypothetical protein
MYVQVRGEWTETIQKEAITQLMYEVDLTGYLTTGRRL